MRLGIFLLFDSQGRVSDHVVYLLAKFAEYIDRLIVMSNGPIVAADAERLKSYVDEVIVRDNSGVDVGGYRDGLLSVGFDALANYDEIVLFNYTVFGPIFDLSEMFDTMAGRQIDFWGVTQFEDMKKEFLQSYFIVTRKRLHTSLDFRDYWLNLPTIKTVQDSIEFHEFRFTPYFVERGFKKSVYIENEEGWKGNTTLVDLPGLIAKRLPIIKYRAFNFEPTAIERRGGLPAAANFDVMRTQTDYPIDLVWDYIIRQSSSDQLIDAITQARITTDGSGGEVLDAEPGCGLVIFLSIEDLQMADDVARFFAVLDPSRIHATSSNEAIAARLTALGFDAVKTSVSFTGAPVIAFADRIQQLVADEDVVLNLSCFSGERDLYYFRTILIENYWHPLVGSAATVETIRAAFDANPRLGLMFTPTNGAAGRVRRIDPICPRASNWTFDTYPADLAQAPDQSRWPWRGNAALSGRLTRQAGFIQRLTELHAQSKQPTNAKMAGIEGFVPELARISGYVSGLAVSSRQSTKMATRHSAEERDARRAAGQQADKFNREMAALRRTQDKSLIEAKSASDAAVAMVTKTLEEAEAALAASKVAAAAAVKRAGTAEKTLAISKAEVGAAVKRAAAAEKALAVSEAETEAAIERVKAVEKALCVAEARAEKTNIQLRSVKERKTLSLERFKSHREALLFRSTPAELRNAVSVKDHGDGAVTLAYLYEETGGGGSVDLVRSTFLFGMVSEVKRDNDRIDVKGWCYDKIDDKRAVFIAIASGDQIIGSFQPCYLFRKDLRKEISTDLTHDYSGFSIAAKIPSGEDGDTPLALVFVDSAVHNIVICPMEKSEIGRPHDAETSVPLSGSAADEGIPPVVDAVTNPQTLGEITEAGDITAQTGPAEVSPVEPAPADALAAVEAT